MLEVLENKMHLLFKNMIGNINNAGISDYLPKSSNAYRDNFIIITSFIENEIKHPYVIGSENYCPIPILEYIKHEVEIYRFNGVSVVKFLMMMNFYKVAIKDVFISSSSKDNKNEIVLIALESVFNQINLAVSNFWIECNCQCSSHIDLLEKRNLIIYNEKNVYLEIFECIPCSIIVLNNDLTIKDVNFRGHEMLLNLVNMEDNKSQKTKKIKIDDIDIQEVFNYDFESFLNKDTEVDRILLKIKGNQSSKVNIRKMFDILHNLKGVLLMFEGDEHEV